MQAHPFESLTPDAVQDAIEGLGLMGDGRLQALSSYENRVYRAHLDRPFGEHDQVVAKFYRPERWSEVQIEEEHAFSAELEADEVPVVAPLLVQGTSLHHHAGFAFSLSPRRGGRVPDLEDFDVLEWIGRFIARIHVVGARQPFVHRPALNVQTFGHESREWLLANQAIPLDVQAAWDRVCQRALECAHSAMNSWQGRVLRLHGDCHPGNILWTPDQGPHFVDMDDARTGPAVQDLWMLSSGDRPQRSAQLSALVDGYEQMREFDRSELALIEPLRTLRLIHYSAWLARRWSDPAFPRAFPWFGSSDYWQGQVLMLEEQIEAMDEPPLMV